MLLAEGWAPTIHATATKGIVEKNLQADQGPRYRGGGGRGPWPLPKNLTGISKYFYFVKNGCFYIYLSGLAPRTKSFISVFEADMWKIFVKSLGISCRFFLVYIKKGLQLPTAEDQTDMSHAPKVFNKVQVYLH